MEMTPDHITADDLVHAAHGCGWVDLHQNGTVWVLIDLDDTDHEYLVDVDADTVTNPYGDDLDAAAVADLLGVC